MPYKISSIEQRYAHYGGGMLQQVPGGPAVPDANDPVMYAGLDFGRNNLDEAVTSEEVKAFAGLLGVELTSAGSVVHINPPVPLEKALRIGRFINGHSTETLIREAKTKEEEPKEVKNILAIAS